METPIRHIERLAQWCEDAQAPAVRISATVVSDWLTATDAADLNGLLDEVMSKIGELPACAQDFLGNDLYQRVQQARGLAEDDDDAEDENSEEDDEEESEDE